MKKTIYTLVFIFLGFNINAQVVGGDNVYEFLNLSPSSRVTALGGMLISVKDDDVTLAHENPATIQSSMHQQLAVSHNIHLSGINHGYVAYAHQFKFWDMPIQGGLQYISYGQFDTANETGQITGSFNANEYAFNLASSKQLYEKLAIGANLKLITSQFESYNSFGMALDLGAFYQDTTGRFTIGAVVKNFGSQFSTYRKDNYEALPFDVQIAISQRLKHLPFRLSISYHNLHRWNILYDDPTTEEEVFLFDENQSQERSNIAVWTDNFFRHFVFSGEFLLGKKENLKIRLGYSHLRRKELSVNNYVSLAGFSGGIEMKIKRFRIAYGHGFYHLAGAMNHFSIATDIGSFRK